MKYKNPLVSIFEDKDTVSEIKKKLPILFRLAEMESLRAGKIGMEVGSFREKILIAFLIHKFGRKNVETEIPITQPEMDVRVFGRPISIKTVTSMGGVKLIWTVDALKAKEFREKYFPTCDMILVIIKWGKKGGLYYIPVEAQKDVFNKLGRKNYIKLPKPGTNPRGVELSRKALEMLITHPSTKSIEIEWKRVSLSYDPYKRWVEYWEKRRFRIKLNFSELIEI